LAAPHHNRGIAKLLQLDVASWCCSVLQMMLQVLQHVAKVLQVVARCVPAGASEV
jgi:hypothetical protein